MPRSIGYTFGGVAHSPLQIVTNKTVQSKAGVLKKQRVSPPARIARAVQGQSATLAGTATGGARLNPSVRRDGVGGTGDKGYYFKTLAAIAQQKSRRLTPGSRVSFEQQHARLMATEMLKSGKTPPAPTALFSSHPFAGYTDARLEFGASANTQTQAILQQRFTRPDRFGMTAARAAVISRNTYDVRGPEPLHKVIPDDGGNQSITTVRRPDGYSMKRVLQDPKRATPGTTQWNRNYPKVMNA